MAHTVTFTPDSMTINGIKQAAGYSVTPSGKVCMFTNLDGKQARVTFVQGHEHYEAALAAAKAANEPADFTCLADTNTTEPETKQPELKTDEKPMVFKSQRPDMADWIDTSIKGKGWEIRFDGGYDKTRVIFKKPPTPGIKALVKEFGFYWSPTMKSWNKGLNCKAHRAAEKLAAHLRYYPEKPLFV